MLPVYADVVPSLIVFNAVLIWFELALNFASPDVNDVLPDDNVFVPFDKVVIPLFNVVVPFFTDDNAVFKLWIPSVICPKLLVLFDNFCVPAYSVLAPVFKSSPDFANVEKFVFNAYLTCFAYACTLGSVEVSHWATSPFNTSVNLLTPVTYDVTPVFKFSAPVFKVFIPLDNCAIPWLPCEDSWSAPALIFDIALSNSLLPDCNVLIPLETCEIPISKFLLPSYAEFTPASNWE